MAVTLTLDRKSPGQQPFGLDTFTESYKCDATADVVLTDPSVPQRGDAHPDYPFMFVTDRYCTETGESASSLDLVYTGCLTDDGDGNPILPPSQADDSDSVLSATSSRASNGTLLSPGASVQYYGPTKSLRFLSYLSSGNKNAVSDPSQVITVITVTIGDTTFAPTSGGSIGALVPLLFTPQVVATLSATEIVSTKYWTNTATKTVSLVPFIFDFSPGFYPQMYYPGHNYAVSDTLTISDGGESATMNVDSVYSDGSIAGLSITFNDFSHTVDLPVAATGGSGTGASFVVIQIT